MILVKKVKNMICNVIEKIFKFLFVDNSISFKKKILISLAMNFGLVFSVFMFIPLETYLGNTADFSFGFFSLVLPVIILGASLIVVMTLFEMLLKGKLFKLCISLVFGVTIACYIQSMFLNGMMKQLDGSADNWSLSQKLINLIIWLAIAFAPFFATLFFKKPSIKLNALLSLGIVVVQLVGFISVAFTVKTPDTQIYLSSEGLYNVSGKKNVIVFILDRFDSNNINEIVAQEPDFLKPLDGFTFYPNTVGSYVYTQNTLPYLITGIKNPDLYVTAEQKATNIKNSEYLKTIREKVDNLNIYTEPMYMETTAENITEIVDNVKESKLKADFKILIKPVIKSALYRVSPFFFKQRFSYTSGDFNIAFSSEDNDIYHCQSHTEDTLFSKNLSKKGLSIDDSNGDLAFKFIHLCGAHFPYHLNANGEYSESETDLITTSKGSLKIVYKYIEELKSLNLYKDAAIFITSDHGETILIKDLESLNSPNVNPIMFYKPSGIGSETEFKISEAPVWHDNIFPTVIEELGADPTPFGTPITEVKETDEITREFYWSVQDPEKDYDYYLPHKYIIEGDSRKKDSWKYIGQYLLEQ